MKNGGKDSGWSPYGCHYYPDPSEFPDPKVSTLPNDPLSAGEQYYLDLAGNIKKVSRANIINLAFNQYRILLREILHFNISS